MPALEVVAADRDTGLAGQGGAPAHEVRALFDQPLQAVARFVVVAVAEQDDAVGLVAVLVIGLPVGGQLLERDQQILPVQRAGAGDRAQHRMEERVDQRVVVGRVLEEQQGQGAGIAQAQAGGVLVDLVVQLAGDAQDALAGLGIDHRAAPQGPRHGRLGDPGQVGDVQGGGFAFDRHGRAEGAGEKVPGHDAMGGLQAVPPDAACGQGRRHATVSATA